MALTENGSDLVMPVQPLYNNNGGYGGYPVAYPMVPFYGSNNNSGFGGGDWGSWIILFLFAMMFGGFGGGFGGMGGGMYGMFPWLLASNANSDNLVQGGFNQAATASTLAGLQNSITTGFSNAEVSACNRAIDTLQASYNNQIASMNQSFANAQALDSRLDALNSSFQNCCCENRLATCQTQNIVQNEANATRYADVNNTRDIITALTNGIQSIKDDLCQDRLDAERRENANLRQELIYARGQASQVAQTSRILADNAAQTVALEQYLNPTPIPAYIVQNPSCCNQNFGCGCGCGAA